MVSLLQNFYIGLNKIKNFGFDELFLEKKLEKFRKKIKIIFIQVLIQLQDQVQIVQ